MDILILNGSPKSEKSITLACIKHLQFAFPSHTFKVIDITPLIPQIEKNKTIFDTIISAIKQADGILWAFPVYICSVPSFYKRFIELLWERKKTDIFNGKYTAVLSTSLHIFDHAAHNYMHAVCDDLNMIFCGSYSADTRDLSHIKERKRLRSFMSNFCDDITTKNFYPKMFAPLRAPLLNYAPNSIQPHINTLGKKIVILTDARDSQHNLLAMIDRFQQGLMHAPEIINLWDIDIRGGCLGCLQCKYDFECSYHNKDGFEDFFNKKLRQADIIIFAGTIVDRFLSARWKLFFDRSFFNNHVPVLTGKQFGLIVSGPLKQLPNLTQMLDFYIQWQESNWAGMISDEENDSSAIDAACDSLARGLIRASQQHYVAPKTFLGIGGHKMLRDVLFSTLRFPFMREHAYFIKNKLYDFPHKNYFLRMTGTLFITLASLPFVTRTFKRKMYEKMIDGIEKYSQQP